MITDRNIIEIILKIYNLIRKHKQFLDNCYKKENSYLVYNVLCITLIAII